MLTEGALPLKLNYGKARAQHFQQPPAQYYPPAPEQAYFWPQPAPQPAPAQPQPYGVAHYQPVYEPGQAYTYAPVSPEVNPYTSGGWTRYN